MKNKALIVGCGLSGAVVARYLAEEKGLKVTMWERRNHIGGNMYDYVDNYGVLVHKYGPHIFHTNSEDIYNYIKKFGEWDKFNLVCGAVIDNICSPTAFNFKTIDLFYSKEDAGNLKEHIKNKYGDKDSATVVELLNCDDQVIREFAQFLFDKDYSLYTAKQWGVSPKDIDPSVLKRVPIRFSYDENYFSDKYQFMPKGGYTKFIKNILNRPNINIELNKEALNHLKIKDNSIYVNNKIIDYPLIYTGPLDELFNNIYGKLPYRSLKFKWVHENIDSYQDFPVVAYPQEKEFTRITEYKKLPNQSVKGTTYAIEYPIPYNKNNIRIEPYYPVLTEESQKQYSKYLKLADKIDNLYLCGRLADFKYYNMDQALERALALSKDIIL